MKYDDDALAEAALLLAHSSNDREMPKGLEMQVLARGRALASELRFTTTKAAAVTVEEVTEVPVRTRSIVRTWGGWFAAAACVAFAVFEWRSHALEHEAERRAASAFADGTAKVELKDPAGTVVGVVRWSTAGSDAHVWIERLPPSVPGEHYRLWLSTSDAAAGAVAVGSFVCPDACAARRFDATRGSPPEPKAAWLTRNPIGDLAAQPEAARTIAEGRYALP